MNAESDEDRAWIVEQVYAMGQVGVVMLLLPHGPPPARWQCQAYLNNAVYCVEVGATRREALTLAIAKVMAARLQGLVIQPLSSPAVQ